MIGFIDYTLLDEQVSDENLRRSVEAAIYKASPLPKPDDPNLYERNLRFIFEPAQ